MGGAMKKHSPTKSSAIAEVIDVGTDAAQNKLVGLVALINGHFEKAKTEKASVEERLNDCLQRYEFEYSPAKLAEIRDIGGSEIYIPLTNMKCRACKAWLVDIFFQPNEPIFSIKPTPIPDLPDEVEQELQAEFTQSVQAVIQKAAELAEASGGAFDMSLIANFVQKHEEDLRDEYRKKIIKQAEKLCEREMQRILDQFEEGGFFKAFTQVITDITVYPTAILKGPVIRKQKRFITASRATVELEVPTFNRVSPFDLYPAPNATNFEDGYIIEILHLTPQQIYGLIGIEGFNEDAIREVLGLYGESGYKVHSMLTDEEVSTSDDNIIDVIEYWGSVSGFYLKDWGIEVDDESAYYDICAWLVDDYLIKVVKNPDPLGKKPYAKASFIEVADRFWGIALPEVLASIQDSTNALSRATINNAVMSSGALIERNIDRLGGLKSPSKFVPFQTFDVHESAINSAPAYRFYQLQPTAAMLIQVIGFFQKMADEYSGVPAYAHGDTTVGGAGRTASGLNMLMTNAARGLKDLVKNIDSGIIEPIVEMQYYFNLYHYIKDVKEIPDLSIKARGSVNLLEREAQAAKALQFLQLTANPLDVQLLGQEGRIELLKSIARNLGLDTAEIFKSSAEVQEMLAPALQELQALQAQTGQPNQTEITNLPPVTETAQEYRAAELEPARVGGGAMV